MAMDEVDKVHNGLVALVSRKHVCEYLAEKQKISNWRKIRPHCYESFSHLNNILVHLYVLVLSYALLSLSDVFNDHWIDGQVVPNYEWPQGLSAWRWKAMLPQGFQYVCLDAEAATCRFLAQAFIFLVVTPAGTNGFDSASNVAFLLWFAMLVVPMSVPEGKDVSIPHIFNDFAIDGTLKSILKLLSLLLSSLDQDGSQVVDPFSTLSGCPCLEIECALSSGD